MADCCGWWPGTYPIPPPSPCCFCCLVATHAFYETIGLLSGVVPCCVGGWGDVFIMVAVALSFVRISPDSYRVVVCTYFYCPANYPFCPFFTFMYNRISPIVWALVYGLAARRSVCRRTGGRKRRMSTNMNEHILNIVRKSGGRVGSKRLLLILKNHRRSVVYRALRELSGLGLVHIEHGHIGFYIVAAGESNE